MVMDGEIQKTGMVLPFTQDIYRPILKRLRDEGIKDTEKSVFLYDTCQFLNKMTE